ncbi:MAG: GNAT family N-acetyltransferase [Desulfurococcales archaeon]|nr:GNAT family N-acetyltransferase [Desulfurococcales archaeon]
MSDDSLLIEGNVSKVIVPPSGYRWHGLLALREKQYGIIYLVMTGSVAQWFSPGEHVVVEARGEPRPFDGDSYLLNMWDYRLYRLWRGRERVEVWPPWTRDYRVDTPYYKAVITAREAVSEEDYEEVAGLEQYHYASKEELVAIWRCPRDGTLIEANVKPKCPRCGTYMLLYEIRGSLPSSRFLILENKTRREYEPRVIGYVRVDTPIPLMHRRVPLPDGSFKVERLIRERVFGPDWFHPTFWPIKPGERREILKVYRELAAIYGRRIARAMVGHDIAKVALARAETAAARIARVVVHPDYRGGGLGVLAVRVAIEWVRERRVPEMKKEKHVVETIAAMARYNPFFEKAGFKYMWDTASGRPVLMYPLTEEARRRIESFLEGDEVARRHGGVLYRPRYKPSPPIEGPIELRGVSKGYKSDLDLEDLSPGVADVLKAFGVERRIVERAVLRDVNLIINPGEVVAVVGASGAGKTTLLRLIVGAARSDLLVKPEYRPDSGEVLLPPNTRLEALIPGEVEPGFKGLSLLEEIASITGDVQEALEVLSASGISDAVLYRASIQELSTGQRERARLAALLAAKPNVVVIDEFTAHLDSVTAAWVAGRMSKLARMHGMTLIVATHRRETLEALKPDKTLIVGYGRVSVVGT